MNESFRTALLFKSVPLRSCYKRTCTTRGLDQGVSTVLQVPEIDHIASLQDEAQKQQKILQSSQLFKSMPQLPAPYFVEAISKFRDELARLEALHQGLASLCAGKSPAAQNNAMSLAALPDVLRSLHELFLHAAARLSRLLEAEERMREAHLQSQVSRGILFDPFAEADARAEMEAAEREKLPVMKPMKPSPAPAGLAPQAAPAQGGQITGLASTAQLALPAPASSSSVFGGTL